MQVFSSCEKKNAAKMQVTCIFWGPRAPKNPQLGLLRCGVEGLFKLLCKTRIHYKKHGFGQLLVLLRLGFPPLPPKKKGALQPGCFSTPNHKTACYGGIVGLFFWQKYCNSSCCKFASKRYTDFMKKKRRKPYKLRGKTKFGQKTARGKIHPNRIFHYFFTVKSHFACFI